VPPGSMIEKEPRSRGSKGNSPISTSYPVNLFLLFRKTGDLGAAREESSLTHQPGKEISVHMTRPMPLGEKSLKIRSSWSRAKL